MVAVAFFTVATALSVATRAALMTAVIAAFLVAMAIMARRTTRRFGRVGLGGRGRRSFAGHVESLAGGTGARFALLPPDNATGNFVKVVQRVPVLVRLDGAAGVELRPGMSVIPSIETKARAVATTPAKAPATSKIALTVQR